MLKTLWKKVQYPTLLFLYSMYGLLAFYGLVRVGLWVLDRDSPFEFADVAMGQTGYAPGDTASIQVRYYQYRTCPMEAIGKLTGECGKHTVHVFLGGFNRLLGHQTQSDLQFIVPDQAFPGACLISIKIKYHCNPIQYLYPVTKNMEPMDFYVLKK